MSLSAPDLSFLLGRACSSNYEFSTHEAPVDLSDVNFNNNSNKTISAYHYSKDGNILLFDESSTLPNGETRRTRSSAICDSNQIVIADQKSGRITYNHEAISCEDNIPVPEISNLDN